MKKRPYAGPIEPHMEFIWVVPKTPEKNHRLRVTRVDGPIIYAVDMDGDPAREMTNYEDVFRVHCVRTKPLVI